MTSVIIRIPSVLRRYTHGANEVWAEGQTVGEYLVHLRELHPGLGFRIFDEQKELRPYINVLRGSIDVRFLEGLETPLGDGMVISIVMAAEASSQP